MADDLTKYRDWRTVIVAGALCFAATLAVMEIVDSYSLSLTSLSIALAAVAGALCGMCLVGSLLAWRVRRDLSEQNRQLDGAINNMIQGLCMFDAQDRLLVWNERYRAMYDIDPTHIWRGCGIRDLLDARIVARTFPLDPHRYEAQLRAALKQGETFTVNIELKDGRTIAVVNQPIKSGGWVATHEDITERKRAERNLENTRAFLDKVIENVPSPIIVKDVPGLKYLLINRATEKYLGIDRAMVLGKTAAEIMPKTSAEMIAAEDREVLASGQAIFADEHPVATPGNGTRIITTTRLPIMDADGKPQYLITALNDVTERKRAERSLESTREFLDKIIENVPSPIIVKDAELKYVLINRAAEKYFGLDRSKILGKTAEEVMPPSTVETINKHDRQLIASGEPIYADEHCIVTPSNDVRIVTAMRLPVMGEDGKMQYLISVIHDLTDRKRDEARIAHMARHDTLTDLPNWNGFNQCFAAMLDSATTSGESFAVLCANLDRFKAVNDVFGHETGDKLLREVARRLETACQSAFLARLGGDEFVVLTPTGLQPDTAEALAERLSAALDCDIDIDGHSMRVGITIGVAIFPQDGADAATLVANADAALFRAKAEARGSIRFFELAMDKTLREKRALQQDLRSAIAQNEIELHYQPQAHIDGEITGFEALVRWHHPSRGLISPATFIPLAEESGMIVALGEWILRSACREAASWPRPLDVSINLSPVQFQRGNLPKLLHEILLETGLAPARIELEITEGVLIGDFERALSILRQLKNLGLRIAMDDFGTGYSSLSYLQSFPFDKIKIDRSFVANIGRSQQAAAIIRAVIALGRGLGLPVVAEGVETEEQRRFLAGEHCNEIQGYLIGKPKAIADYAAVVGRRPAPQAPSRKRLAATG